MHQRYDPNRRPMTRVEAARAPSLLAQVLGITSAGFVITAAMAYVSMGVPFFVGLIASLAGFGMLFAISATRNDPTKSLAFFYGFTALEGIGIAPTINRYVSTVGSDVVVNAAATTGLGMAVLAAVVYSTSIDFRRMQGFAAMSLLALMVIGIITIFTHFLHPATYAWATLAVFTMLVLVDFGRIRAGGDDYTPVELAVQIYLDGINIFQALLVIFGVREREE